MKTTWNKIWKTVLDVKIVKFIVCYVYESGFMKEKTRKKVIKETTSRYITKGKNMVRRAYKHKNKMYATNLNSFKYVYS